MMREKLMMMYNDTPLHKIVTSIARYIALKFDGAVDRPRSGFEASAA